MQQQKRKRTVKRIFLLAAVLFLLFLSTLFVLANFFVEPVLRKRLHTLIVEGSDSLYTYTLGDLHTNLFGGNVEVKNLSITVDSTRYETLKARNALPALVMQLKLNEASIKGIGVFSLVFGKKIFIDEISSKEADINLLRNFKKRDTATNVTKNKEPLWKVLRSKINAIGVKRINLEGIKLLYKNNQEIDAAKLQFDRCDALFQNIRIDSASLADTSRIGYVENFSLKMHDLKFRTADSTYKLKAEWIVYNSAERRLQIDSFKLQPTLKNDERVDSFRKSWYTLTFDRVTFNGLRLDRYLRLNRAEADSAVFQSPTLSIYQDKLGERNYRSKIGSYPHQVLLRADAVIDMKKFVARNMQIAVTEKDEITREEGTINLSDLNVTVDNIVNDPALIKQNPVSTALGSGKIFGSPVQAFFRFYLDSADGKFDVKGNVQNIAASQINPVASKLANVEVPSVQIDSLNFFVRGEDFEATADVQMRYRDLSLILRKRDDETGRNSPRKFLNKILNRFAIYPANPYNGEERKAIGVKTARLTTQTFFGLIWKAVFDAMQRIMLKSGTVG
ncbi:hypothetical protein [Flavisolibacter ginsenosidimutans]|uniref:DUF748 domain-containing protein n=1 Tax=Flavisolibacter ginsenosidimutans TaxID=661481 RepID=A0A5B8ULR5_9BACT|nr:hypothetical protein [Flavisolibacter ginsenosidimutans]QEC57641.1 hypothetical protein FSB75_17610 [Flavisolibacter ginsenosidimutans]